jgi:predicted aldo/keto reductase-like oxidoreductase
MEILRLWTYAKSLDLVEWGKMRYNLLGNAGHWFPGQHVGKLDNDSWRELESKLQSSPVAARIPEVLRDAHDMLLAEEVKRQSQS